MVQGELCVLIFVRGPRKVDEAPPNAVGKPGYDDAMLVALICRLHLGDSNQAGR